MIQINLSKFSAPVVVASRRAYDGVSMDPERRAQSAVAEFVDACSDVIKAVCVYETDDNQTDMQADLERWLRRMSNQYAAYLHAKSRTVSQFITGPGGWLARMVRSNQKRMASEENRWNEFFNTYEKAKKVLIKKYRPRRWSDPIRTDDPQAVGLLEEKIANLQRLQEFYKSSNRIVRKKKQTHDEKILALRKLAIGLSFDPDKLQLEKLLRDGGFRPWVLSNNNANLRRMKQRLQNVQRLRAQDDVDVKIGDVEIVTDVEVNRVRMLFSGKPDADTRKRLKQHGFRWSPRVAAWQAYINNRSLQFAKALAKELCDGCDD